jgi:Lipopolysaccharide kinase (Kdo/WaaP) family
MKRAEADAFRPVSTAAVKGLIAKGLAEDCFTDFLHDPDGFVDDPAGDVIKDGTKSKVVRKRIAAGNGATRSIVVKRFRYAAPVRRLGFFFAIPPALKALRSALRLKRHGFATAEPLAAFQCRSWKCRGTSYYIAEEIADGLSLRAFWLSGTSGNERLRIVPAIIRRLAELFFQLHRAGLYHRDLKGSNILMRDWQTARPRFFLVDLEVSAGRRPLSWRKRFKNLLQVRLAWSARERAYFYFCYAKLCRASRRDAKALARRLLALHAAARHHRRTAGSRLR